MSKSLGHNFAKHLPSCRLLCAGFVPRKQRLHAGLSSAKVPTLPGETDLASACAAPDKKIGAVHIDLTPPKTRKVFTIISCLRHFRYFVSIDTIIGEAASRHETHLIVVQRSTYVHHCAPGTPTNNVLGCRSHDARIPTQSYIDPGPLRRMHTNKRGGKRLKTRTRSESTTPKPRANTAVHTEAKPRTT